MGVIPIIGKTMAKPLSIPHVCGGDPPEVKQPEKEETVFPTYVGVILWIIIFIFRHISIPHVCGGDPESPEELMHQTQYSPRMWG